MMAQAIACTTSGLCLQTGMPSSAIGSTFVRYQATAIKTISIEFRKPLCKDETHSDFAQREMLIVFEH